MNRKLAFAGGLAICYACLAPAAPLRAAGLYEPSLLPSTESFRAASTSDIWGGPSTARMAQVTPPEDIQPEFSSPPAEPAADGAYAPAPCGQCGGAGCSSCTGGGLGGIVSPSASSWGAAPIGFSGFGNCCGPWYGGIRGLVMTRDQGNNVWLSSSSTNTNAQLLTTRSASMGYAGGFETYIGRYLNQCWAIEAGYWGLFPGTSVATLPYSTATGPLVSRVNFAALQYNNGQGLTQSVAQWYANAQLHRISTDNDFQNVEANALRNIAQWGCPGVGGSQFQMLAGVRYLRVGESLQYATDYYNTVLGDNPNSELAYNVNVVNNLVGFQIGGRYQHQFGCRFLTYAGTKVGIFGNHITHHQDVTGGYQTAYLTSGAVDPYNINSSKNDVAFVGELDLGAGYQISRCWRITGGYRAIGLSGVALATDQIPPFFGYYDASAQVNSSNSMIIHGAYAGIECNF